MRTSKTGHAAIEFAIGATYFAFIMMVLIGYVPVFLKNIQLQSEARCDAGISALGATEGSDNLGGAAAFTSRAHPPVAAGAADPWTYPIKNLPEEFRFGEWCGDAVSAWRLIPGGRTKDFHVKLKLDGTLLVDDDGFISEELYMPAMGGLKTVGGDR